MSQNYTHPQVQLLFLGAGILLFFPVKKFWTCFDNYWCHYFMLYESFDQHGFISAWSHIVHGFIFLDKYQIHNTLAIPSIGNRTVLLYSKSKSLAENQTQGWSLTMQLCNIATLPISRWLSIFESQQDPSFFCCF